MAPQGKIPSDMIRQCVPGGVDNVDHNGMVCPIPRSAAVKAGTQRWILYVMQKGGLPLLGERDGRQNDFHAGVRIAGKIKIDRVQREHSLSRTGCDMDNAPEVMGFPCSQAFLLPGVQFHSAHFLWLELLRLIRS